MDILDAEPLPPVAALSMPRRWTWPALTTRARVATGALAVFAALCAQHAVAVRVPAWIAHLLGAGGPGLTNDASDPRGIPSILVASSLLAIGAAAVAFPDPYARPVTPVAGERVGRRRVVTAMALLVLPALGACALWSREDFAAHHAFTLASSSWAVLLWLLGLVAGLTVLSRPGDTPREGRRFRWRHDASWPRWPELLLVAGVVISALGLRTWHLGTLPQGIWWDEADSANNAWHLAQVPFQPFATVGHTPSLYHYVMALLVRLGGNNITMVRLDSALFGVLAVVAVYVLGRIVGGAVWGLVAATLLAVAQWAVDFSRLGMLNITAPAMLSVGAVALAIALCRPSARRFAWCGVMLGLALLAYEGGFLAVLAAMAMLGLRALVDRPLRHTAWPGLLLVPLGVVVSAAPLLFMLLTARDYTLDRITTVSLFHEYSSTAQWLPALEENLRRHLLMLMWTGDTNGRHNLPGAPMLDPITGACLLLGLGISLRHITRWFSQFLLFWLIVSMLGGILSLDWEAPQAARTVGAIAPIVLLAAMPLTVLSRVVWRAALAQYARLVRARTHAVFPVRQSKRAGQKGHLHRLIAAGLATAALAAPLGAAGAFNVSQYFIQQSSNMTAWAAMSGLQTILGRAAATLQQRGYTVRIDPYIARDLTLAYASGGRSPAPFDPAMPVPLPMPSHGLALLILAGDGEVSDVVRQTYPLARTVRLTPNFDHQALQATAVLIQPRDVSHNLGMTVTVGSAGHSHTRTHVQGTILWPSGSGPGTSVALRSTLVIPAAQAWHPISLRAAGVHTASISLDGETWRTGDAGTPPLLLGAGNHRLTITAHGRAGAAVAVQWVQGARSPLSRPGAAWVMVPRADLMSPDVPAGGLLSLYYKATGTQVAGSPVFARIDQTVALAGRAPTTLVGAHFGVLWAGTLHIAQAGVYDFALNSRGPSRLLIDNVEVTRSDSDMGPQSAPLSLAPGDHQLRLVYEAENSEPSCILLWAPPGHSFMPLSPDVTVPLVVAGS